MDKYKELDDINPNEVGYGIQESDKKKMRDLELVKEIPSLSV